MTAAMTSPPILYTFRRCPYAMRARLALAYAGIAVELREVLLKDKPAAMLAASAKATVPVLQPGDGMVLDESMDIMFWALQRSDAAQWLPRDSAEERLSEVLIAENDGSFKRALDRYKYWPRFTESSQLEYRRRGEVFLSTLETTLLDQPFLLGAHSRLPDQAIFPFVRQFATVDTTWFDSAPYPNLHRWLQYHLESPLFASVMRKYPQWQPQNDPIIVQFSEQVA